MKNILLILLLFCTVLSKADEKIFPKEVGVLTAKEEEFKNLQWNRYTTKNFTILSINNEDGRWLYKNIENLKNECMQDWGIKNHDLSVECRVMVVDNETLLKKFFNLTSSKIEFRNKNNKLEIIGVWLNSEKNKNKNKIKEIISEICFVDLINKIGSSKLYIEKGLPSNYKTIEEKKEIIKSLDPEITKFIKFSKEDFNKLNDSEKIKYQNNCTIFCLMLKKELGTNKFLKLILSKDTDNLNNFLKLYKYKNYEELEKTYKRYCKDLKNELEKNSINDKYLKVGE